MTTLTKAGAALVLNAQAAEDLMTPNPVSIHADATIKEAAAWMTDKEISGAPVIDEAGHAVGVLSRADIVRYERETPKHLSPTPEYYRTVELASPNGEALGNGFQVESTDTGLVRDIMTPTVIGVSPEETAIQVVSKILAMKIHRLFVVEPGGVLVGVISAFDVLRKLRRAEVE